MNDIEEVICRNCYKVFVVEHDVNSCPGPLCVVQCDYCNKEFYYYWLRLTTWHHFVSVVKLEKKKIKEENKRLKRQQKQQQKNYELQVKRHHQIVEAKASIPKNPGISAVLSFFVPGLGHIYNGEVFAGFVIMLLIVPMLVVLWLLAISSLSTLGIVSNNTVPLVMAGLSMLMALGIHICIIWSAYSYAVSFNIARQETLSCPDITTPSKKQLE